MTGQSINTTDSHDGRIGKERDAPIGYAHPTHSPSASAGGTQSRVCRLAERDESETSIRHAVYNAGNETVRQGGRPETIRRDEGSGLMSESIEPGCFGFKLGSSPYGSSGASVGRLGAVLSHLPFNASASHAVAS